MSKIQLVNIEKEEILLQYINLHSIITEF